MAAKYRPEMDRPVDRRHLAARASREPGAFKFSRACALWVPGETITCPREHELSASAVFLPAGLYQCRSRDHVGKHLRGGAYCGVRLWVWHQPEGGTITVWIEESEWETIEAQRLTVAQTRDYLGLRWPGKAGRAA